MQFNKRTSEPIIVIKKKTNSHFNDHYVLQAPPKLKNHENVVKFETSILNSPIFLLILNGRQFEIFSLR